MSTTKPRTVREFWNYEEQFIKETAKKQESNPIIDQQILTEDFEELMFASCSFPIKSGLEKKLLISGGDWISNFNIRKKVVMSLEKNGVCVMDSCSGEEDLLLTCVVDGRVVHLTGIIPTINRGVK
jgi:hypothetical protein